MQFKKILAAGTLAAIMAGSSIAFAATLADFPSPFVTEDGIQSLVVVGAAAAPSDVVGAIDIATRLGGEVTTEYTCAGTTGGVSVTDGILLETTNTKIRLGDVLNVARDTLTKDNLPSILPSLAVVDKEGTEYKYDQYIQIGGAADIDYDTSGNDLAEVEPIIDMSLTTSSSPLYSLKVIFTKDLKINTTSQRLIDGKSIKLFGQEYTFGSGTGEVTTSKIVLYGGGKEVGLDWDGTPVTQTVTVGTKTVEITLNGITANDQADLTIDGVSQDLTSAGTYITSTSGVRIYVKSVARYGQGNTGRVVLKVGADKLVLQNGNYVKVGTNEDNVKGTYVTITPGSVADSINQIQIDVYAPEANADFIKSGSAFTDPVFKSFKLAFYGFNPSLTATTRSLTTFTYSGDNAITASITDDRGNSKTLTVAYNYYGGSAQSAAKLMDNNGYEYIVVEGQQVGLNNYTIINQGGFSHLLQVTNFDVGAAATTKTVKLKDVMSGTEYEVTVSGTGLTGTKVIDGKTYYFDVDETTNTSVAIHRGSSARTGSASSPIAVYTPLKLKNGEEFVLMRPVQLAVGGNYSLPGNNTVSSGEGLCTFHIVNTTTTYNCGSMSYTWIPGVGTGTLYPTGFNLTGNTNSAAFAIIEEKDNANVRGAIRVGVSTSSDSSPKVEIDAKSIADMMVSSVERADKKTTNTYITRGLDYYGTLVERNTDQQGTIKISYPDDQVVAVVAMGTDPQFSLSGETEGTKVKQAVPVKTPLGKLDTEITSSDKTTKNLILVGGPAVNILVRELADAGKTKTRDWYIEQGAGTAIIDLVENAFTSGKSALVVAGHSAEDTRAATTIMQTYDSYKTDFTGKKTVIIKNGVISTAAA